MLDCFACYQHFEDRNRLIEHQRSEHFNCPVCQKGFLSNGGMAIHLLRTHKQIKPKFPSATPEVPSTDNEKFGTQGDPPVNMYTDSRQQDIFLRTKSQQNMVVLKRENDTEFSTEEVSEVIVKSGATATAELPAPEEAVAVVRSSQSLSEPAAKQVVLHRGISLSRGKSHEPKAAEVFELKARQRLSERACQDVQRKSIRKSERACQEFATENLLQYKTLRKRKSVRANLAGKCLV